MAYGPFPGAELEFDLNAKPVDDANGALTLVAAVASIIKAIDDGVTDLFVISHGWNNDKAEARALYMAFFETAAKLNNNGTLRIAADRKVFVVAVLWPSARFVDATEIPGGAAGVNDPQLQIAQAQLQALSRAFAGDTSSQASIDKALALLPKIGSDPQAGSEFVLALNALPTNDTEEHDSITTAVSSAIADALKPSSGAGPDSILNALAALPPPNAPPVLTSDDSGGAAGIFDNIKAGALSLASLFTYKTMKERAGVVGQNGLAPALEIIRATHPNVRIHLAGHSFGARLVTSAANTPWTGDGTNQASTLSLLQGAFSHFGFAVNYLGLGHNGAFRDVVGKPTISGPINITHSVHDTAVGWAYPAASLVFGQVASGVEQLNPFGGMGADGAVSTPEAVNDDLLPAGQLATPLPDRIRVRNLCGDAYISGHGDITGDEVVYAVLADVLAV